MQLVNAEPPASPPPPHRRFGWLRRGAIDLGDVAVQVFSVVVGILLALFINDWVTQRQQQQSVDEAMRAIHAELAANEAALRSYAPHMLAQAKAINDLSKTHDKQPPRLCFEWSGWAGIGGLNLTDAAYQTAIATQAMASMPFKQAHVVAQIYGWQHSSQKEIGLVMEILTRQPLTPDHCAGFIHEIGETDLQLANIYSRYLEQDNRASPKTPAPRASQLAGPK